MNTSTLDIDESIEAVVIALNQLPDLDTFSSCGGHAPRVKPSQMPAGYFYVSFAVVQSEKGWWSLSALAYVVMALDDVKLNMWYNGPTDADLDREHLAFQLEGGPKCSRAELAAMIVSATWAQPQ